MSCGLDRRLILCLNSVVARNIEGRAEAGRCINTLEDVYTVRKENDMFEYKVCYYGHRSRALQRKESHGSLKFYRQYRQMENSKTKFGYSCSSILLYISYLFFSYEPDLWLLHGILVI
jgi:hypothetical protein